MTDHTPAPWHAGKFSTTEVFSEDGRMKLNEKGITVLYPICTCYDFAGEAEANARLIAAAPELLSLVHCFAMIVDYSYEAIRPLQEQAQLLYAKATDNR